MKTSDKFSLDLRDAAKGLIIAISGAVIAVIETCLNTGSLSFNWHQIGMTAIAAGLAYLAKNFFTPAKIIHHEIK